MKKGKRAIGVLLTLAFILSMSLPGIVFAEGEYSISVENAKQGETYQAYKIFDATYSASGTTYYIHSYDAYYSDVAANSLFRLLKADDNTYQVTWDTSVEDEVIIQFFTDLGAKGSAAGAATAEAQGDEPASATIFLSDPGYYFVTTTLGSVISITTANPDGKISDKNSEPVLTKGVRDESHEDEGKTETDFEKKDEADIGDTLEFEITIAQAAHLSGLCLHDYTDPGLSFGGNESISVYLGSIEEENIVSSGNYTITNESGCHEYCQFQILFKDEWLDSLSKTDVIIVTYTAVVNEQAAKDNWNHAILKYGDASWSVAADTDTRVFGFKLKKTDENGNKLDGAVFTLRELSKTSDLQGDVKLDEVIYFVKDSDGNYIVAKDGSKEPGAVQEITVGSASIFGLEAGSYQLEELKAPDGYNRLDYAIAVTIDAEGNVTISGGDSSSASGDVLTVINQSGTALPGTGGIGTTIFYVLGVILILGAGTVLIMKRQRKGTR